MRFKKGDMVRILPRNRSFADQHPVYTETMNKYAGNKYVIDEESSKDVYRMKEIGYSWHKDWLELITIQDFQLEDEDLLI